MGACDVPTLRSPETTSPPLPAEPLFSAPAPELRQRSPNRPKYPIGLSCVALAAPVGSFLGFLWRVASFLFDQPGLTPLLQGVCLLVFMLVVAVAGLALLFVGAVLLIDDLTTVSTGQRVSVQDRSLAWGLALEGSTETRAIPPGAIQSGHIEPGPQRYPEHLAPPPVVVVLACDDEEVIEIDLHDRDQAEALLLALGLGVDQRAASFALRSPLAALAARGLGLAAAALQLLAVGVGCDFAWALRAAAWLAGHLGAAPFGPGVLALLATALWLAAWWIAPTVGRRAVVVGIDGVGGDVIPGGFASWAEASLPGALPLLRPQADAALLDRCREARQRWESADPDAVCPPELERAGRSVKSWRDDLVAPALDRGPYRGSGGRDVLLHFLTNSRTPRSARVAAAVALASQVHGGRDAVRAAARLLADPEVRRLLTRVAEGDDAGALEAACLPADFSDFLRKYLPLSGGDLIPPQRAMDFALGAVVGGKYRIEEHLGSGSIGAVYRVRHVTLKKQLALKVLLADAADDTEVATRFEREALVGAHVNHPNVAAAVDYGVLDGGFPFLVLELVRGVTLRDVLLQGRLPPLRAARIARGIAAGLGHLHERGILHRDLKPANVMLVEGAHDDLKIIDFGLSRIKADSSLGRELGETSGAWQSITAQGHLFGTIAYMPPEVRGGVTVVDERGDLYTLGVIFFEMLAGRRPFEAPTMLELLRVQINGTPPSIRDLAPGPLPGGLIALIDALLLKDLTRRPQSAAAVIEAIDAALLELGPPPSRSVAPPRASTPSRLAFPGPDLDPEDHLGALLSEIDASRLPPGDPAAAPPDLDDNAVTAERRSAAPLAPGAPAPAPTGPSLPPASSRASVAPPSARPSASPTSASAPRISAAPTSAPASGSRAAIVPPEPTAPAAAVPGAAELDEAAVQRMWGQRGRVGPFVLGGLVAGGLALGLWQLSAPGPAPAAASASASASAAPAAPAPPRSPGQAIAALREATDAKDARAALAAARALGDLDPEIYRRPEVTQLLIELATGLEFRNNSAEVRELCELLALAPRATAPTLFAISRRSPNLKVVVRARESLASSLQFGVATPPLRATLALLEAPCAQKISLLERATREGDARTLTELEALQTSECLKIGGCCLRQSKQLTTAIAVLRRRAPR